MTPPRSRFKIWRARNDRTPCTSDLLVNSHTAQEFIQNLNNVSPRTIRAIEWKTRGQADNALWFKHRSHVITGSVAHQLQNAYRKKKFNKNLQNLISKTLRVEKNFPALKWGRDCEVLARNDFIKRKKVELTGFKFEERGLMLASGIGYLGASIDGMFSYAKNGSMFTKLIEIKCPYSLREKSIIENGADLYYLNEDLSLKKTCSYYSQIQFYLWVYKLSECILLIWCPQDFLEIEVEYDKNFCDEMMGNLCKLYKEMYAPSLFESTVDE